MRSFLIFCGFVSIALSQNCMSDPSSNPEMCMKQFSSMLENANKLKPNSGPGLGKFLSDEVEDNQAQDMDLDKILKRIDELEKMEKLRKDLEQVSGKNKKEKASFKKRLAISNNISGENVQTSQNAQEFNDESAFVADNDWMSTLGLEAVNPDKANRRLAISNKIKGTNVQTNQNVVEENFGLSDEEEKLPYDLRENRGGKFKGKQIMIINKGSRKRKCPANDSENEVDPTEVGSSKVRFPDSSSKPFEPTTSKGPSSGNKIQTMNQSVPKNSGEGKTNSNVPNKPTKVPQSPTKQGQSSDNCCETKTASLKEVLKFLKFALKKLETVTKERDSCMETVKSLKPFLSQNNKSEKSKTTLKQEKKTKGPKIIQTKDLKDKDLQEIKRRLAIMNSIDGENVQTDQNVREINNRRLHMINQVQGYNLQNSQNVAENNRRLVFQNLVQGMNLQNQQKVEENNGMNDEEGNSNVQSNVQQSGSGNKNEQKGIQQLFKYF